MPALWSSTAAPPPKRSLYRRDHPQQHPRGLDELREVMSLLRETAPDPQRPQPTLADLPALLEESTSAGLAVSCTVAPGAVEQVERGPASTGRTAYRVVQEALTNVRNTPRRRASRRGAATSATASTSRSATESSAAIRTPATPPGSGTGLIGLRERVGLAGGPSTSSRRPIAASRCAPGCPMRPPIGNAMTIGVLIVDDDALVRSGLAFMLRAADASRSSARPATATRCPRLWPPCTRTSCSWTSGWPGSTASPPLARCRRAAAPQVHRPDHLRRRPRRPRRAGGRRGRLPAQGHPTGRHRARRREGRRAASRCSRPRSPAA